MSDLGGFAPGLVGQRALITGAGRGLGPDIARALAAAGARVALNCPDDPGAAAHLAARILASGGAALAVAADTSREEQVRDLFRQVVANFGGLDILVTEATLEPDPTSVSPHLERWDQALRGGLAGQFLCVREAMEQFVRQGVLPQISSAAGKILCVSPVHDAGGVVHPGHAAARGGVALLVQALAREAAAYRIRVNRIAPGAIRVAANRAAWARPGAEATVLERIPYGRVGDGGDVARAALWLVSDAADYVTGVTLHVDGGMSLCTGPLED